MRTAALLLVTELLGCGQVATPGGLADSGGTETRGDVSPRDTGASDAPIDSTLETFAPGCEPMDAHEPPLPVCEEAFGVAWDGHKCVGLSCSCVGSDCGKIWVRSSTRGSVWEACMVAYNHCREPPYYRPGCLPMKAISEKYCADRWVYRMKGNGECEPLCPDDCEGEDCAKTFKTQEACEAAFAFCRAK